MELNDAQRARAAKLADLALNGDVAIMRNLMQIQDACDMTDVKIAEAVKTISEHIKSIRIPEPIDDSARFDEILAKLSEPVTVKLTIK
jgi:hypothetical protein